MTMITLVAANLYNQFLMLIIVMQLETKLTDITTKIQTYSRPLAILALIFGLLTFVAEPMLPDAARENKGVIRRVLFALLAIGLVPDLVALIA